MSEEKKLIWFKAHIGWKSAIDPVEIDSHTKDFVKIGHRRDAKISTYGGYFPYME